jgi:hypothetical protein
MGDLPVKFFFALVFFRNRRFPFLVDNSEIVEKPASERLMENVHMQGFRNPEE